MSCIGVRKFQEDIANSREPDKQSFVEKKDGTIVEANEAVLRTPLFGKATIELDKETKIPLKEIEAYQNKTGYYKSIRNQFAPRFKKGLINMYVTHESQQMYSPTTSANGAMAGSGWRTVNRTVYWIQKKGGNLEEFKPQLVGEYVKDYQPASEFVLVYEANQKKVRMWSWINTVAVIGGALVAGSGVQGKEVSSHSYVGVGFFLGGLANGFVNKLRRANNIRNLEAAIDTYNYQVVKKK
jgi:hypothetical protein